MHKSNEDCFYFLTSSCAKGASCTYRHSPLALTCNVVCPSWIRGNCPDPACPFRHSQIQRPMAGNGILCFYENTATGCLKPECTFIHSRPRLHLRNNASTIRPALINPLKTDSTKPTANNNTPLSSTTQIPESNSNSSPSIKSETTPITPSETSSPSNPTLPETIKRRIAIPSSTESSNENKDLSENPESNPKCTTRSIITDSAEETTNIRPRLVINRNVTTNVSTRSVIPTTSTSSNRVVISSSTINSTIKEKQNHVDSNDEAVEIKKKFKASPNDASLPSSTSNRLLVLSSNEITSTNDTKPIRLNRHRLAETKPSSGNSSQAVSTLSHEEEKTPSPGTGLLQDNQRRTMRLERFQNKSSSPPTTITTTNALSSRSVVTSSTNQRKRTAPETTVKDTPPPKRLSNASSPNVLMNSSPSIVNKNPVKPVEKTTLSPAKSVPPAAERPRFVPQLITPPSTEPLSSTTKSPQIRQPPSVVIKRPAIPPTVPSSTSTKPMAKISSNIVEKQTTPPVSSKSSAEHPSSNISNNEDENQLLKLNEPTDIVDTFALIDEALREADHLLELI